MRADVNVSVRKPGEAYRTRCEIKNVNSVRYVMQAIEAEAQRQVEAWESGGTVDQETRHFDPVRGVTRSLRTKEDAHDYRYFPDPDLLPLCIEQAWVDRLQDALPELPEAKRARLEKDYGLSRYESGVLTAEQNIADFFESVARDVDHRLAVNWVLGDFFGGLNRRAETVESSSVDADGLRELLLLISDSTINGKIAKDVLEEMFETGESASSIVERKGLRQITDTAAIAAEIEKVLEAHADKLSEYRNGKDRLYPFFVGQTMKAMKGKANPAVVNEILKKLLAK